MAVVLKTTKVQAFGGSNPSPSARLRKEQLITDPFLHVMDPRSIQVQKATLNRKKTVRDVERLNRHR